MNVFGTFPLNLDIEQIAHDGLCSRAPMRAKEFQVILHPPYSPDSAL